jgi:polysaccharide biosynthesis/export protein
MKKKCFPSVFLYGTFLFFSPSQVSPQPNIPPDLLRQYQSNPSSFASSEKMQQLIKEYQKQKGQQTPPMREQVTGESKAELKISDTTTKSPIRSAGGSIYENILNNINIHPDSLLSSLAAFGYDVFSQSKPSTFAPSDFASVPSEYPIFAGDEIIVMLWGRINEEYRLQVLRTGTINIPRIGPVSVSGLPFEIVQKNILDRVESIEGVHASVTMGQLRSIGIYIVGEVVSPGFYTISSLSNISNALFAAGGPTRRGSLRNIQLKRNSKLVTAVDYYDFLLGGSDRSGLRLQSGDVIYVPIVQCMAAIAGNVRRSGLYEFKGKTQLSELIKLAGGITPSAWTNRIQVERFMNRQFQGVLDIESSNDDLPRFEILDGDIVKIFPILVKDKNAVYLSGNVLRPGKYEFRTGMHINDVVHDYQDLLPESYFNYAIVLRQNPETFSYQIFPFNLQNALDTPSSAANNLPLEPKDEIIIYNKDFFEPDRSVSIDGAVTKPGTFKLLDNMKIRDLVLQAGGLRLEASRKRGELYRRNMEGKQAETQKIDFCVACAMLDDSSHNLPLLRSDRVYIRQKQGWEEEGKVLLSGRFVYPGTYVILEGETLGDLIKRSGGFKEDAYLSASVFTRKSVKELELKRKNEYLQQLDINMLNLSSELALNDKNQEAKELRTQLAGLRSKLSEIAPSGRIVIDLSKPEQYDSFALEDGDVIFVPRNMNTISVIGDVYNPSTFTFNHEKISPWYYIESSGGLRETADKKHIYVVKANGLVITKNMQRISSISLAPGDAIVVPQRVRLTSAGKIFQETVDAIFKIATVAAVVITLIK